VIAALLVMAGLMFAAAGVLAVWTLRPPGRRETPLRVVPPELVFGPRLDEPEEPAHDPQHDTVMFVPIGPADGDLVRLEGRVVVVDRTVRAPSGRPCVMYELYTGKGGEPARALRRAAVAFYVDDGATTVRIDPDTRLVALELPTDALSGAIERRLEPGARVQVVGRLRRFGAPGHEELTLHPPPDAEAVTLQFVAARAENVAFRALAVSARPPEPPAR
jgi:hypothetical protein